MKLAIPSSGEASPPEDCLQCAAARGTCMLCSYIMLKLFSLAAGMICCEWWAFEVIVLFAGLLADPKVAVSVMGICMNINSAVYALARGTSGESPPDSSLTPPKH